MALRKTTSRMDFILMITNYFHGHWEEPVGSNGLNQVLIGMVIREFAAGLGDATARKQIVGIAEGVMAKHLAAATKKQRAA